MLVGVGLIAPTYFAQWQQDKAVAAAAKQSQRILIPVDPQTVQGTPERVELPDLGITRAVIIGSYNTDTGDWTLTPDKAQFADRSVVPNSATGNTLIYGHATDAVFGSLTQLAIGNTAKVYTDNGYVFTYVLDSQETVSPTDVGVFSYKGKPRLTLQTCSGTWSQNRTLYYFSLTDYRQVANN
ncbi:sortase [Candidatus Saccharibacteria bacterium]|nr:sortase [Candidatus Saccharibacteria bacterium]